MVATEFTTHYNFAKPDFDIVPWHDDVNTNFDSIDALIFAFTGVGNVKGVWLNDTVYVVGDRVVDDTDGTLWQAQVSHTSAATGSFADDRAANPTFWLQVGAQASQSGFRNKIINGGFDVWQRGTSFSQPGVLGTDRYTADRWRISGSFSGGETLNITRQAFPLGQTDVPGNLRYFIRMERTVAGVAHHVFRQAVENVRTLSGQIATLTFYYKGTPGKNIDVVMRQNFGTGGTPSIEVTTSVATGIGLTGNWQKHSVVFFVPSISGKTLGTNGDHYLALEIGPPGVEGVVTFDFARASLVAENAVDEPDPFSERDLGQEILLCQRFFAKTFPLETVPASATSARGHLRTIATGNGAFGFMWDLPTIMRTIPTVTTYNRDVAGSDARNASDGTNVAISVFQPSERVVQILDTTASAANANDNIVIHATAQAELG